MDHLSSDNALQARQISLSIGQKVILHDIGLSLPKGKVLGVLGPNGAGKTSLLKALSGQRAFEGDVAWQGMPIRDYSIQGLAQQIAVVNQVNDVVFSVTLQQVVRMGLLPHKSLLSRHTRRDEQRIEQAIQAVGLEHKQHQEFSSLSGGEQQRALIARALVQGSPLLILDEPVNHLDVYYQHQILQLLHDLASQLNVTIVMSLHDMNLAAQYCDKLALLSEGQLVAFGQPNEVLEPSLLTEVFNITCSVEGSGEVPNVVFKPERKTVLDLSEWRQ